MTILEEIKQNPRIPKRCSDTAVKSAHAFETLAQQYGMTIEKSPDHVDWFDHIDYYVTLKNRKFTVDIKSAKKFFETPQISLLNEWVWIEFKNVKGGDGWLYGKADYIVYVFLNESWFIKRTRLINFIEKAMIATTVTKSYQAKYKYYKRQNRDDLITLACLDDIKNQTSPIILRLLV